jgi:hypothetical protein
VEWRWTHCLVGSSRDSGTQPLDRDVTWNHTSLLTHVVDIRYATTLLRVRELNPFFAAHLFNIILVFIYLFLSCPLGMDQNSKCSFILLYANSPQTWRTRCYSVRAVNRWKPYHLRFFFRWSMEFHLRWRYRWISWDLDRWRLQYRYRWFYFCYATRMNQAQAYMMRSKHGLVGSAITCGTPS